MNISRELLNAKKAEAIECRERHQAGLNAAIGAINTVDHLLAVLDLPEPKAPPPAPSSPPNNPPP